MGQARFARFRALSSVAVFATIVAAVSSPASAQEPATGAADASKAAIPSAAPKFYSNYQTLINAHPGLLPIERNDDYVGTSLLPFGSRDKAIAEAKENALKSQYKVFILTHDREERTQSGLVSGISRVIKLRGVEFVEKSPENVLAQLERPVAQGLHDLLIVTLKEPAFVPHIAKLKALVQQDRDRLVSGIPAGHIVKVIVALEGKESAEDLKKWARYHRGDSARFEALVGLIGIGELAFVETAVKDEKDRLLKLNVEEKLRKARLGA